MKAPCISRLFPLYFFALLVAACGDDHADAQLQETLPRMIEVRPREILHDTTPAPTVIAIDESKLTHVPVVNPLTVASSENQHTVRMPTVIEAGIPAITAPGKDTFAVAETITAEGVVVPAKQPEPVSALPLRMKDGASCNIQYLDVDQGMNSSYIWDIYEDNAGYIWMATDGGGVTRYDGRTLLHFTEKEGLASSYVRSILQDNNGNFWFATINGLSKYDGTSFTNYTTKNGLKHNSVWALEEDSKGNIWIGTYGGGVSCFDGKAFTHYTTEQGFPNNSVWDIYEDKTGALWFGTNGSGVVKYYGGTFTTYTSAEGLCDNTVFKITQDLLGDFWFGTNGGLSEFDGKTFSNYTTAQGLPMNIVRAITTDQFGNLLLGTYGGGAVKFDAANFTWYTPDEGLNDGHVVSIAGDDAGNFWFATYGGGICKFDPASFKHYTDKQGLTNFFVWSTVEDSLDNLWFGTNGGGVAKYDGESFTYYTTENGLTSNFVRKVFLDSKGIFWFGTYDGGITRFDGKTCTQFREKDGLCGNTVLDILEDNNGNLWITTDGGGISVYDGKNFTNYTVKQGLCSNYIRALLKDSKGTIWLGTHAGLCSYNPSTKNFTRYNEGDDISLSTLWTMCEDAQGNIWMGTGGYGVIRYSGNYFTYFTEQEGLSNNSVWSICSDGLNLWMGTEKGLNCMFYPNGNFYFVQFHREDGLKAEDYYLKSAFLDRWNCMWWGTGKSLCVLDMSGFGFNTGSPKVQVNNVFLHEEFVDYRELKRTQDSTKENTDIARVAFSDVSAFGNLPSNLELPYSVNHLTFHFSATDWEAPHAIRYQYQLEGLDQDWSQLSRDNKADYRNIPYGDYTFKVKAIGSTGLWSDVAEYRFVIHPPWWHTWWARTLGVILVLALIYSYMQWRERALKARQKELQTKVTEATSEIKLQKNLIEEKHKAITDSINYAERIQRSFLATKELLDENLKDYFVLYLPKDVVSGDFYWAAKLNDGNFGLVTADSTGHGVPGAIMSLLNITSLEKACETEVMPSKILNQTRSTIIERLSRDGTKDGGWDGMDCSFISFNFAKRELHISAANNPVWILRNGTIIEVKPDRFPVGKHELDQETFRNNIVPYESGDVIYTMTDGFADQFGGPLGKKFKWKQLQKVLIETSREPMNVQRENLYSTFRQWKQEIEQIDDVCVIGIRMQ